MSNDSTILSESNTEIPKELRKGRAGFIKTPRALGDCLFDLGMKGIEYPFMQWLISNDADKKVLIVVKSWLCQKLKISDRTLRNAEKHLIELGLLERWAHHDSTGYNDATCYKADLLWERVAALTGVSVEEQFPGPKSEKLEKPNGNILPLGSTFRSGARIMPNGNFQQSDDAKLPDSTIDLIREEKQESAQEKNAQKTDHFFSRENSTAKRKEQKPGLFGKKEMTEEKDPESRITKASPRERINPYGLNPPLQKVNDRKPNAKRNPPSSENPPLADPDLAVKRIKREAKLILKGKVKQLQNIWLEEYDKAFGTEATSKWDQGQLKQAANLITARGLTQSADSARYLIRNWASINKRFWKGSGTSPALPMLLSPKSGPNIAVEAARWLKWHSVREQRDAFLVDPAHEFDALPSDLSDKVDQMNLECKGL